MRRKRHFVPTEIYGSTSEFWGKRYVHGVVEGNFVADTHQRARWAMALVLRIERVARALS